MSPIAIPRSAVLVVAVAVVGSAFASEPGGQPKLNTSLVPRKSIRPEDRASVYLERTPEFVRWDGNTKINPSAAGFIYVVEQSDGARLLLTDLHECIRGWTSGGAVVPLSQAESTFSQQIQANPKNAFAFLMRGVARGESDQLDQAMADLDEALRLDPKYVPALLARGYLRQWRNQPGEALADLNKAIEIDSRIPYAFVERGILSYNMKQYDKALRDFQAAIDLGSRSAVIYVARGMIHLAKGDPKKAQVEFNQAVHLDPRHPDVYRGYAAMFLLRGNTKKALSILDQAIGLEPRSPDSHGNRAVLLLSIGMYDKALDDLNEVIRFAPNSARAHKERAWLLATCPDANVRNGEQAVTSATRACELTEWKEPPVLATLAAACSEAGDFPSALKWQQKAVDLLPDKAPERHEYSKLVDRYKAKKPYRQLSILEEMGVQIPRTTSKKGA
jgi:tetratricopeptide (TPR) repeat protein